jgi:hypothetical protein
LGDLATPKHILGSLLPDGVPFGRRDLGLLRIRPSAPSQTVLTYAEEESFLREAVGHPTLCHGPSADPQRALSDDPFQCLAPRSPPTVIAVFVVCSKSGTPKKDLRYLTDKVYTVWVCRVLVDAFHSSNASNDVIDAYWV